MAADDTSRKLEEFLRQLSSDKQSEKYKILLALEEWLIAPLQPVSNQPALSSDNMELLLKGDEDTHTKGLCALCNLT